ncbi:hypothetical protein [Novosphingobium sp. KACC 22771]|uniref:hypothetical protein n=1 Tax=Novosphingobium sp. KACC 22771 TaxID=3025670 RepID=UPI002365E70A|nr:hypothetical protein [Novosphingobium sp. KACC 22771]WDF72577.1 hypothetical protein PQ467_00605 [Novosphingobium sp. KACC 22771]
MRSRATAIGLSAAIMALFIAALLSLGLAGANKQPGEPRLVSIQMDDGKQQAQAKAQQQVSSPKVAKMAEPPKTPVPAPPEPTPTTPPPPNYIKLSHDDFAASDIGAIGRRSEAVAAANAAAARAAATGPGEGPKGVHLYAAQWYREPSDAELRPFLSGANAPPGAWATIACQTIDHFHVENCQELDEYPLGSGLARGLRRASWQFLVWPPRIDGKPQVGTWVRIRFDFTKG